MGKPVECNKGIVRIKRRAKAKAYLTRQVGIKEAQKDVERLLGWVEILREENLQSKMDLAILKVGVGNELSSTKDRPRYLPCCGSGSLWDEQQYCFEKGWREGRKILRKRVRIVLDPEEE